jgi:hypothetical protein
MMRKIMLYDLKEGRSLNVLNYDIETEASLRGFAPQMISTISITLELEKSEVSYIEKWFYERKRDIIISSGNGAQKLLGCYIRNINNFEYSISVEITADSLILGSKELVAIIRDIKLEELLNPQKNNIY